MKPKNLKDQIDNLKQLGKTVAEIAIELNCSKSAVYYNCNDKYKEFSSNYRKKYRTRDYSKTRKQDRQKYENTIKRFRNKIKDSSVGNDCSYEDFKELINNSKTCYLSGRNINPYDGKTCHIDHKIPVSKGGDNSINNLGFTCKEVNMSKSDMTIDEFLTLCKDVLTYNGYVVTKK